MKARMKKIICLILICLSFITSMFISPNEVKAATQADQIISYARRMIGSMEYNNYCQRFVKICYQSAGIYAASDAASAIEAWNKWGLSESKTGIPVGACVYFNTSSGYGHVGIYTGDGKMIDAQSPLGVQERTISNNYWNNYLGWGYQAGTAPQGISADVGAPDVKALAGDKKVSLYWNAVAGAMEYWIYTYNSAANAYSKILTTTGLSCTLSGFTNGTTYAFLVRAYNGNALSGYTSANLVYAKPIAAPFVTALAGDGKISLYWSPVSGAECYRIYAYNTAAKTYSGITTLTGTSYTQSGLVNGRSYTYLILAYNGVSWSMTDSAYHVTASPIAAPSVTVSADDGKATLKWNTIAGAVCYRIYSYNTAAKTYSGITTVTGTSYTQSGLVNGRSYTYLVLAYNGVSWNYTDSANHISVVPHK